MTEALGASDKYCAGCGEPRLEGKEFCANCGRSFTGPGLETSSPVQTPAGRLAGVTPFDVALLGSAALLLIAPFFPFLSATAALVGSISRSGVEITNGEALVIGGAGLIIGFATLRSLGQRKGGVFVLLGLISLGLSIYYYVQIADRVGELSSEYAIASVGAGIWMALAGSAVAVVSGFLSWRSR